MAKKATTTDAAATDTSMPDTSQLGTEVTNALASADTTAAQRIQTLQWVHQARASQLTRTAAALKAQFGANDPGVKAAEANVAAATLTAARIGMAQRQAATPDPQVSANGWALHGRVFDAQLQPMSGFTVFLVDASKTYQQAYGFAYTDADGYFLLNFAGPDAAAQDKSAKTASSLELFVEIANAKSQLVYLSPVIFQPVVGGASYLNIELPAGNEPIGDPPAQIRDVAVPPKEKPSKKNKK
jgi:hypothetical protein